MRVETYIMTVNKHVYLNQIRPHFTFSFFFLYVYESASESVLSKLTLNNHF